MSRVDRAIRLALTVFLAALTVYALVEELWGVFAASLPLTFLAALAASGMVRGRARGGPVEVEAQFSETTTQPAQERAAELPSPEDPPPDPGARRSQSESG